MTNPPGAMDRPFLCPYSEHCIRSHYPFIISDLCPLGHWEIFSVLFWHIGYLSWQTYETMGCLADWRISVHCRILNKYKALYQITLSTFFLCYSMVHKWCQGSIKPIKGMQYSSLLFASFLILKVSFFCVLILFSRNGLPSSQIFHFFW